MTYVRLHWAARRKTLTELRGQGSHHPAADQIQACDNQNAQRRDAEHILVDAILDLKPDPYAQTGRSNRKSAQGQCLGRGDARAEVAK